MRFGYPIFFSACFLGLLTACSISSPLRFPASDQLETESELFQNGLIEFNQKLDSRKALISNPRHYPKILHHGNRTEYVVVFAHGLFESPDYMRTLSQVFYDRGMNVVLPLLPGHWSKPPEDLKKATAKEWLEDEAFNIGVAQKLGSKIILAGYSTGGALAIEAAFSKKYEVSALILFAPALGLHMQTAAGSEFGSILGIAGNGHLGIPMADGYDVPFYAPQAGLVVWDLIKYTLTTYKSPLARNMADMFFFPQLRDELYAKITVPTFLVGTKVDDIVSKEEIDRFYKNISGPKKGLFFADVNHRDLVKSKSDIFQWRPDGYNKYFDEMVGGLEMFMDDHKLGKKK